MALSTKATRALVSATERTKARSKKERMNRRQLFGGQPLEASRRIAAPSEFAMAGMFSYHLTIQFIESIIPFTLT
jgi:hypothetical protein